VRVPLSRLAHVTRRLCADIGEHPESAEHALYPALIGCPVRQIRSGAYFCSTATLVNREWLTPMHLSNGTVPPAGGTALQAFSETEKHQVGSGSMNDTLGFCSALQ
jgi:hypothetical protein